MRHELVAPTASLADSNIEAINDNLRRTLKTLNITRNQHRPSGQRPNEGPLQGGDKSS